MQCVPEVWSARVECSVSSASQKNHIGHDSSPKRTACNSAYISKAVVVRQCHQILPASKLAQAQPFSEVLSNVIPTVDHVAQCVLCRIKALRCSQPIVHFLGGSARSIRSKWNRCSCVLGEIWCGCKRLGVT